MLTAVGVIAIVHAGDPGQPSRLAGAVLVSGTSSSLAVLAAPTTTSRPVNSVAAAPVGSANPSIGTPPPQSSQNIHVRQSGGTQNMVQAVYLAINRARAAQ